MINCVVNISKEEIGLLKQNKARIVDEDNCFEYNEQELRRLDAICKWINVNKDYELRIDSSNKNRQAIMALPWDSSFDAKSAYFANDIHFVVDSQETAPPRPGGGGGPNSFTPHGTQSLP